MKYQIPIILLPPLAADFRSDQPELSHTFIRAEGRALPDRVIFSCVLFTFACVVLNAAESKPTVSAANLLARTKILSSDEFEGRAPGSAGEEKTVNYLVSEFKKLGLRPGNPNGTYIQDTPLVGITSRPTLAFTVSGKAIFVLPGSPDAVKLAMTKLILPELGHVIQQLDR